jgi:GNAT superfamily N-acetyltransferase
MTDQPRLVDITAGNFATLPCCGIKDSKHPGRQSKDCWMRQNFELGLRTKALIAGPRSRPCGYLEFIPGEYAWRGVEAPGYLFIHCVWIYSKPHQRRGLGAFMLESCLQDARENGKHGVVAMARKGPWSADARVFQAVGFEVVDTAPPDYQLLARIFDPGAPKPTFRKVDWEHKPAEYGRGLTIVQSAQCPHIAKFASDIAHTALAEYDLKPTIVELKNHLDAQNAPTPYAVFAILYNGEILADHQISRTRFRNIMDKKLPR